MATLSFLAMAGTPTTGITEMDNNSVNTTSFLNHTLPTEQNPGLSSRSLTLALTSWMWLLWPPIVLAMGTSGNMMTIAVLSRMGRKGGSSITLYLLPLSWSDLVVLYAGLLRYWVLEVFQYDLYSWSRAVCKAAMWLYGAAWTNSTYLLVALTLQRAISVVWPHRVHVLCTRTNTLATIGGIAVASLLLQAHVLYGYDVVVTGEGGQGVCGHGSQAYYVFNADYWVYVEIVTFSLLPFFCLVMGNGVLAWTLAVSVAAARTSLASSDVRQVDVRRKKASSTTTTVMVVSVVFIVLNLPLFVLIIINSSTHIDAPEGERDGEEQGGQGEDDVAIFLQSLLTILLFCNSAVNFYLYCLTGTRFRQELRQLMSDAFCHGKGGKTAMDRCESVATEDTRDDL